MAANGYKVTLIGRKLADSLSISIEDVKVVRFKLIFTKGPLFYMFFNIWLFFYLIFHKCNILLSNDLDTLFANYLAFRINKSKLVYDSHEYFTGVPEIQNRKLVKLIWEKIEYLCIPRINTMYTVNDSIAEIYRKKIW